jgi:hypothetical protein
MIDRFDLDVEKFSGFDQIDSRPTRGRPRAQKDDVLRSARHYIHLLFDSGWGEIGWRLAKAKNTSMIYEAVECLDNGTHGYHVVNVLLTPDEHRISLSTLRNAQKEAGQLGLSIMTANENYERRKQKLDQIRHILKTAATPEDGGEPTAFVGPFTEDQSRIADLRGRHETELERARSELNSLTAHNLDLKQRLSSYESYFVRSQLLDFCRTRRYRLTPWNTACAMAGLPFVSWRQSIRRCLAIGSMEDEREGLGYLIFKFLRRELDRSHGDFLREVEIRLRSRTTPSRQPFPELRENWYHLRSAIELVQKERPRRNMIPYRILCEYWGRRRRWVHSDQLLVEEDRITV